MILQILKYATPVVVVLFGTMAGFFFAFSNTVMPGFDGIDPVSAIEGMQGINSVVRNATFFVTFFLTPIFALGCVVLALVAGLRRAAVLLGFASVLYLAGVIGLTVYIHIPLNEALALETPRVAEDAAAIWQDYSQVWTPWNTVRMGINALAALVAAGALMVMTPTHVPSER